MYLLLAIALLAGAPARRDSSAPSSYDRYPVYTGRDLGLRYNHAASAVRIWSPTAQQAQLLLYTDDRSAVACKVVDLDKGPEGSWGIRLKGDWKGYRYTFRVRIDGAWRKEVPDPYARAVGVNGKRAVVLDLRQTDPPGWPQDRAPAFSAANLPTDAVIYELHIRDISIDSSSGIRRKGKYLGLAEWRARGSTRARAQTARAQAKAATCLQDSPIYRNWALHISICCLSSIITRLTKPGRTAPRKYNWGYDPLNYNAPEGSYSTDPFDAATRIRELKQLIGGLSCRHGLRVVMDHSIQSYRTDGIIFF